MMVVLGIAMVLVILAIILFTFGPRHARYDWASPSDRVMLVTSHPDDEAMFFAPTICSLRENNVEIFLLCLSNGNAAGLGKVREKELVNSCKILKIDQSKLCVYDDPQLQDGMSTHWPTEYIASIVERECRAFKPTKVLTFDADGISSHPNHIQTCMGVRHFFQNCLKEEPLEYWELTTVNLIRKLSGMLDALYMSMWAYGYYNLFDSPSFCVVLSPSPGVGIGAMLRHWSQLVWFRVFFIAMSRYTYVNGLRSRKFT